ncbi:MAG: DUF3574 domain-containing protein [Halieaceae bacterium]|nr:DUF3574 domain-containing protein [Halieaceae bacterium]
MGKRRHFKRIAEVLAILSPSIAPATLAGAPPCPAGTEPVTEYRLFFGSNRGEVEVVSDAAWGKFLADEITPRFADGLSVLDAAGQWRDGSGAMVRERTRLVLILTEPGAGGMQRSEEVMEAYQRSFGQESVLRLITPACASN